MPLKVVYTPLNGTGNKPVREILRRIGVSEVAVVPEQELPDGRFPTAPYPNPEIRQAFECALKLAETVRPDLLLATDPDCDRVGIAVKDGDDYTLMTGNEVGCLLLDYILSCRAAAGTLPADPVVVKTIVTSDLAARIAEKYGCQLVEVLTGFKYIGEQIGRWRRKAIPSGTSSASRKATATCPAATCGTRTAWWPPCWCAKWPPIIRKKASLSWMC